MGQSSEKGEDTDSYAIFDIGLSDGEDEEGTKNIIYPAMFCLFKAKFSPKN